MKRIEEESFAMEILKDYKKQNKRLFVIWLVTFLALICVTCYLIFLLNDVGTYTETVTQENDSGYNNYIGNNGDILNGKAKDNEEN